MHLRAFDSPVVDGVPHQVLKYVSQLRFINPDCRQEIVRYYCTALLNRASQVCECCFQCGFTGNLVGRFSIGPRSGIGQQVPDQPLHTVAPVYSKGDKLVGIRVQASCVALGQQLRITGNHAQRLLEIVG